AGTKRFIKKDIEARGIQAKADKIKLEETQKEQRLKIWREDPSKVLIEHLQLTTITTNLLRKQEIFTLQNILDYYSLHGNFEFIKSLGPVRRQEVYSKMQEIGVDLNKYFVNSQQGRLKNAITHPNNVLIEDLGLSNRAFNLLKRQGVNTLSDLVDLYYKYNGNFTYIMNLGVVYQEEISLKIKELGLNTNQDNLNV
ncbi:MAG: hypothetical protein J6Q15_02845, partial [Clostridia bacterium]|nr:hypothetical protein [Clostridia bacterium]